MLLLLLLLLVGSSLHSCCWSLSLTAVVGGGGEVGQSVDESSFFRAFLAFFEEYYVFGLISIMCVQCN